jgi:hypothetical protein
LDRNQKYTILERRDGVTLWKQPKKFIAELKEKHFDKLFYSTEQFPSVYSGIEILEENFAKEYICRKTKAMQCWYGSGCGIELKEVLFAENQTYMIIRHSEQYYYIFDFKLYLECKYMEDFIKSEILIISK